jgi:hypothetical protein
MKPKEMTSLPEMQMEEERQAMTNKEWGLLCVSEGKWSQLSG